MGALDVGPCTEAGVEVGGKAVAGGLIEGFAGLLKEHVTIPIEAEPVEIIDELCGGAGFVFGVIEIFDS